MTTIHTLGVDCWIVTHHTSHFDRDSTNSIEAVLHSESDAEYYIEQRHEYLEVNEYLRVQLLKGGSIEQDKMP